MNTQNGGYVLIDCKGLDLLKGSTEQTIDGLYKRLTDTLNLNKLVIATNCKWGTLNSTPIPVMVLDFGDGTIIATFSTLQVVVTDEDTVTIRNMIS